MLEREYVFEDSKMYILLVTEKRGREEGMERERERDCVWGSVFPRQVRGRGASRVHSETHILRAS